MCANTSVGTAMMVGATVFAFWLLSLAGKVKDYQSQIKDEYTRKLVEKLIETVFTTSGLVGLGLIVGIIDRLWP